MSEALANLLRKPVDTIERPKAIPAGTYTGVIKSHEFGKSKNKGTDQVTFQIGLTGAEADVPQELLEGIDLSKKTLRSVFYLTPDSQFRLVDLGASCGLPTSGVSLGEVIDGLDGCPVMVLVSERRSDDGSTVYNDIAKIHGVA